MKKNMYLRAQNLKFSVLTLILFLSFGIKATNLYWIGGTGNWNDNTHWSLTSGGAGGAALPTSADNVFFDANSFSAPSQTVTINSTAACADMDWTGAAFNPLLTSNGGAPLSIHGSLTFIPAMTFVMVNSDVYFRATATGKTVTTAGLTFNTSAIFDGVGGGWTLVDAFTGNSYFNLINGSITSNNNTITCGYFTSNSGFTRSLNLGTSIVNITAGGGVFNVGTNGLTFNGGASTINFTNTGGILTGGTHSFNNVNWTNASSNGSLYDGLSYNKIVFSGTGDVNPSAGTYYASVNFQKVGFINPGNGNFGKVTFSDNGTIVGTNSYDSLIFSPGKTYSLQYGFTQTINNLFQANGTCSQPILIKSNGAGTAANISSGAATIAANYVRMQDITATGGAVFTANTSIDLGNNTGWTINAPTSQNLYWVGGAGNWDDANHWSLTSGGAPGTCIPNRYDNVYFDANSFTVGSKIVTINNVAECDSMNWTGATNTPILTGTPDLNIYGSLKFISAMTNSFSGKLYFRSTNAGNIITSAGKSFSNEVHFDGANADWTLQDAFSITGTTGNLYVDKGYLVTNDKTLSCYGFLSTGNNTRGLYLGNSTINVSSPWQAQNSWQVTGSNFTLDAGTSLIRLTAAYNTSFYGGAGNYYYDLLVVDATTYGGTLVDGAGFNNVTFNGLGFINTNGASYNKDADFTGSANSSVTKGVFLGNGILVGNNNFDTLSFAGGKMYTLSQSQTQTLNTALINGTCSLPILIKSNGVGVQANMSSTLNNITVNYVQLQDINATGGMTFVANNSTDLGNNSGWTINAPTGQNLYWRGGSGNWNDATHWSLTSGGAGGACVPTSADHVFFDNNSFTAGSKVVTLNVPAYCKSMTWTGASFTPVLTGTVSLNIYGSLTFISAMTTTGFTGVLNFKSTSAGNTITSAGKTFNNHVNFDGIGGYWTLQDALNTTTGNLYLDKGTLNTNGKNVTTTNFISITSSVKQLTLGSSTVTITGVIGTYNAWHVSGANFSISPGTSHIVFTASSTSIAMLPGVNTTYNNITFQDPILQEQILAGPNATFHNVTFNGVGYIYGPGTFNKIDFKGSVNNYVNGNNSIDSLLFASGSFNYFASSEMQTINKYLKADGSAGNLTELHNQSSNTYSLNMSACTICQTYVNVKGCDALGGAAFYADNSTNGGNNTGWTFGSCPSSTLTVGPITGSTNTCINTTGNVYSIPSLGSNATYTWTVPVGLTITSGQGTTSIQVSIGSTAGTISVTATDCGTTGGASKTITVNPVPVVSSVSVTPATCSNDDGSATATVTSGSSPYNYVWSSGDTLAMADSLYSGQYQLTVSDLYGCVTSTVVTVSSSNGPQVSLSNTTNVTCPGGSTGSLTVSVTGGVAPYTYAWTNGATTSVINNLMAGTYVVTITDSTGCQVVGSYNVTQPAPINITFSTTPSGCSNSTGDATANVTGGTAGYTYQWSANAASQTSQTASALAAGLYSVVVTDNASCQQNASVMVSTNTAGATVTLDNITAGTCGINGPGSIDISTSGGAFPYTYNWSNGASTEDITGIAPGTYSLGVIDANGCMTFTAYTVPNGAPAYQPEICLVTFDTITSSNLIAWEKTGAVGIKDFKIYCEIGSYNNYQLVGTVPAGNLSEFTHVGANPQVKSWKYKISAVDSCGNEGPLSTYHKSIHLQVNVGIGGVNNLSWDNYFGFNYGSFEVWRYHISTNWVMLNTIPFCGFVVCQNGYTDNAPIATDTNWYAIFVNPPTPCVTTARLADPNSPQGTIVKSKSNITNNRVQGAIGISENSFKNELFVYPNPATSEVSIRLGKTCNNCSLEITNTLGQTVRSEKLLSYDNKINIAALPNGVYYLKIKNSSTQYVQKLVVQH